MRDILQKHLERQPVGEGCVVSNWINDLPTEEQELMNTLKETKSVVVAALYKDLRSTDNIPFKLTAFRSHMRGYCSCPRN